MTDGTSSSNGEEGSSNGQSNGLGLESILAAAQSATTRNLSPLSPASEEAILKAAQQNLMIKRELADNDALWRVLAQQAALEARLAQALEEFDDEVLQLNIERRLQDEEISDGIEQAAEEIDLDEEDGEEALSEEQIDRLISKSLTISTAVRVQNQDIEWTPGKIKAVATFVACVILLTAGMPSAAAGTGAGGAISTVSDLWEESQENTQSRS